MTRCLHEVRAKLLIARRTSTDNDKLRWSSLVCNAVKASKPSQIWGNLLSAGYISISRLYALDSSSLSLTN
uniref:Uncharacterized protein n=1 Tax=Picea glauca TaxID=3330 RepID=A0A124GNT7_PICGL|nr:hypothetical protein ABT39_MTgene3050 [Picea glauca]